MTFPSISNKDVKGPNLPPHSNNKIYLKKKKKGSKL